MAVESVDVSLPRFSLTSDTALKSVLQEMGIRRAFRMNADLSGIDCRKMSNLFVSDAFHKAAVRVNEEGTTASAATDFDEAITIFANPSFNVNRPFLFVIMDNRSETVLFIGTVVNPRD